MLATVSGTVAHASTSDVVIDVHGVGFHVLVPAHVGSTIRVGETRTLHTVLIPRDDEWTLYGFESPAEKTLFTILRGVTGVGPKTALAILSTLSTDEITDAVSQGDDAVFRRVSGVGGKTASLIIVSLTGKMPSVESASVIRLSQALVGLGWSEPAARECARDVNREFPDATDSEKLKTALARMSSGN